MKTKILLINIILATFIALCFNQQVWPQEVPSNPATNNEEAIIILATETVSEMHTARKIVEEKGARVRNIFPPSAFIVNLPKSQEANLKELDFIKEISYEAVDLYYYRGCEQSTRDAISMWNRKLEEKLQPQTKVSPKVILENEEKEPFTDEVIMPENLPKTKEEKMREEDEYLKRRELKKLEGAVARFGKAYGAGYHDTSLYMAGDIAVGVFFDQSEGYNWTSQEIDNFFIEVCDALDGFIDDEPNAGISFTYIKEVDQAGIPHSIPGNISEPGPFYPREALDYVNDIRNTYNTHWSYMIIGYKKPVKTSACLFGPIVYLGSRDSKSITRHETMHIFGVMDQYLSAQRPPVGRWGYLYVVNANSEHNNGEGYFGGAGESINDIMINCSGPIGAYSRGQVGWRDSDGDGVLDPLDTYPDTCILNKTGVNSITYTGRVTDKALLNSFINSMTGVVYFGDVTFNSVTKVEYRINGGAWCKADPTDGVFDSGEEEFSFTTPALSDGTYLIEVRAANSVGNVEVSYAKDEIVIQDSSTANIRPFANFSITPEKGSIETDFTFDASSSSDIEDSMSNLQVRWDFENDGTWDTAFSYNKVTTYNYSMPGTKTITLEVKDTLGLTHAVTEEVDVLTSNISPKAFFTVTPENIHGIENTFDVQLDATGIWDGESALSNLRIRWDFEDDGEWDTNYSDCLALTYSYPLPTRLPTFVLDTLGYAVDIDISGDYVYVADYGAGLQIIDISNPEDPILIKTYDTSEYAISIHVAGNYAYIADGSEGLQILDISDVRNPVLVGHCDTSGSACRVSISGDYAYVAADTAGLQIIDISDPTHPTLVGHLSFGDNWIKDVCVSGEYAYVVSGRGLDIIDIKNPAAPVLVGGYYASGGAYGIFISGNRAYVAGFSTGLHIIDITNPATATLVGSYDTPGYAYGIFVSGDRAYVADYLGLQIIDISNPTSPISIFASDTKGIACRVCISGDYAYVAADTAGLQIIDISEPFKVETTPISKHWKARLEIMDPDGNTSQTTRDMWVNTYNHPPLLGTEFEIGTGVLLDLVGNCDTPDSARNVQVSGDYAYVADSESGLQIINIADPITPVLAGSCEIYGIANDVDISGDYAYVAGYVDTGSFPFLHGLNIIDISNPESPALVGNCDAVWGGKNVHVAGDYAYVADAFCGLQIIDISNPAMPTLAANFPVSSTINDVYVSGDYAYVTTHDMELSVISISNPAAPALIGNCSLPDYPQDVYVSGNFAYVATNQSGLQVVDISNPEFPTLTGSIDIFADAPHVYVSGNNAYIAGGYKGLLVVDITDPTAPEMIGNCNIGSCCIGVHTSGNYAYVATDSGLNVIQIQPGILMRIINSNDPDLGTTWDGLLEYRWDFENDGVWDTRFSYHNFAVLLPDYQGSTLACEVKDRFNATSKGTHTIPLPNRPPVLAPIGNKTVAEMQLLNFTITATDPDIGDTLTYSAINLPTGANLDATTGEFSWTPTYEQAGNYSVTFTVSDGQLSDSKTITITVTEDIVPPTVTITSPENGRAYRFPFTVICTATDNMSNITSVYVSANGGTPVKVDIFYGQFKLYVYSGVVPGFVEGSNTITVTATDDAGNVGSGSVTIDLDTTLPTLNILSPARDGTVQPTGFVFTGTAEDASGIGEIRVSVEDRGRGTKTVDNELANYDTVTKEWNFQVLASHITPGAQAYLSVTAWDALGNYIKNVIPVNVEGTGIPPTITLTSPAEGGIYRDVIVEGKITDDLSKITSVSISVNGDAPTPTSVSSVGTFSYYIPSSSPRLVEGTNTITITAQDDAGNTGSVQVTVICDKTKPTLTITSPLSGVKVPSSGFLFGGTADDLYGVAKITIDVYKYIGTTKIKTVDKEPAQYNPDTKEWSFQVLASHISEAKRVFLVVICWDKAGNGISLGRNVSVEEKTLSNESTKPPIKVISPRLR